jgi:uncharacterized protein YutE (UPF0331/DUF86 family)
VSAMHDKLKNDSILIEKQLFWLEYSLNQCSCLGIQSRYEPDEFGYFEALCSRFSRSIDFLVRKIYRSIDEFELENQGTLIDTINRADKRGLIDSVEQIRVMKDIRNTIVHEYIEGNLEASFEDVLSHTQALVLLLKTAQSYIEKSLD